MPTINQHKNKALMNEQLGEKLILEDRKFSQWAIVAYFYSALHWVDAYIAKELNLHPQDHHTRTSCINRISELRTLYAAYRHLQSDSRTVRYDAKSFPSKEISAIKNNYFIKIKNVQRNFRHKK